MRKDAHFVGLRFGRLIVLELGGKSPRGHFLWLCKCDCGTEKLFIASNVRSNFSKSCGCLLKESQKAAKHLVTHGLSATATYKSWSAAKSRCGNPSNAAYRHYGGRGIRMCDEWKSSFEEFFSCLGEKPSGKTLDRINVNGHYEPGNCRWATASEQRNNVRCNRLIIVDNVEMTVGEAYIKSGVKISRQAFYQRLDRGWSVKKTMSTPKPLALGQHQD